MAVMCCVCRSLEATILPLCPMGVELLSSTLEDRYPYPTSHEGCGIWERHSLYTIQLFLSMIRFATMALLDIVHSQRCEDDICSRLPIEGTLDG